MVRHHASLAGSCAAPQESLDKACMCAGVQQLPAATPYALEALAAPSHALRRLGCQQLGAALPVSLLVQ